MFQWPSLCVCFSQGNEVQRGASPTRRVPRGTFAQFQRHKSSHWDWLQVNTFIFITLLQLISCQNSVAEFTATLFLSEINGKSIFLQPLIRGPVHLILLLTLKTFFFNLNVDTQLCVSCAHNIKTNQTESNPNLGFPVLVTGCYFLAYWVS